MTTPADMGILTGGGLLMPNLAEEMQAETVPIEGGTFDMGAEDLAEDERPVHPVGVSSFQMQKFAVTNRHFENFGRTVDKLRHVLVARNPKTNMERVIARAENPKAFDQLSIDDIAEHFFRSGSRITLGALKTFVESFHTFEIRLFRPRKGFDGDRQPVVDVNWFETMVFLAAVEMRLPTEAEWEFAATGPRHDAKFGTKSGNVNPKEAHYNAERTVDVGSYPANGYGLYDMAGNASQWVIDWLGRYPIDGILVQDSMGPVSGEHRVVRGGSWFIVNERSLRAAYRSYGAPVGRYDGISFRGVKPALSEVEGSPQNSQK